MILLLYILFASFVHSLSYPSLPFAKEDGVYHILFKFGESNMNLPLSLEGDYIVVNTEKYKPILSRTYKLIHENTVSTFKGLLKQIDFTDMLYLSNELTMNIHCFLMDETLLVSMTSSEFGLSPTISRVDYSLIHLLKKNEYIRILGFTLYYNKVEHKGVIYFGDIPSKVIQENDYVGKCKINNMRSKWGCSLDKVLIGDRAFINNKYAYFQTNEEFISIPNDFYTYLNENEFSTYIERNKCKELSSLMFNVSLICDCDIIEDIPSFTFVFEKYPFIIEANKLFIPNNENKCRLIMNSNANASEWIFGTKFLDEYISHYNYETKEITFFSNNANMIKKLEKKMYILLIIVIFFGFLILFIVSIKYNLSYKRISNNKT